MFTTLLIVSVALLYGAEGLDMEAAKEQKCFNVTKTVPSDPKFVASMKTIYYPMVSRLELYRISSDLLERDGKDIIESDIYYDSCLRFSLQPNGSIIAYGFDNRMKEYLTKPHLPNLEKFDFTPADGKGFSALAYTVYTDNKSFFISVGCTNDGEMTWSVGSMYPTLQKDTKEMIIKMLKELGFKKEFATGLRYDYCDLPSMEDATTQKDVSDIAL